MNSILAVAVVREEEALGEKSEARRQELDIFRNWNLAIVEFTGIIKFVMERIVIWWKSIKHGILKMDRRQELYIFQNWNRKISFDHCPDDYQDN